MTRPTRSTARLLVRVEPAPTADLRLVCLPYAGGGAAAFAGWPRLLGPRIDLVGVRLPGRENRFGEPPYRRLPELIGDLVEALETHRDLPVALYGHSVGALVAYELARALPRPAHLVVAGAAAPHLPPAAAPLHREPDDRLRARLERLGGLPPDANPALLELMLPTIRDDLAMAETHRASVAEPLDCPLLALTGREDPSTALPEVAAWRRVTTGRFAMRSFPGGHFFVRTALTDVLTTIRGALLCGHGTYGRRE